MIMQNSIIKSLKMRTYSDFGILELNQMPFFFILFATGFVPYTYFCNILTLEFY
jgi:hypothetical protein